VCVPHQADRPIIHAQRPEWISLIHAPCVGYARVRALAHSARGRSLLPITFCGGVPISDQHALRSDKRPPRDFCQVLARRAFSVRPTAPRPANKAQILLASLLSCYIYMGLYSSSGPRIMLKRRLFFSCVAAGCPVTRRRIHKRAQVAIGDSFSPKQRLRI
jgi:hypothetical protein